MRSWSRFAIGRRYVSLPVTEVTLGEDGLLRLVMQHEGKARRFTYAPATGAWHEVGQP